MHLPVEDITPETFASFGQVIEQPGRAADAGGPGWAWWGELVQLPGGAGGYAAGYLDLRPASLRFDWAERHMLSAELLAPLGGDCLIYVAPADTPDLPQQMPALERFRVFRVRQGQAVLLAPGVWHGAPFAIDRPLNVLVLLRQGTGAQDVYINRFEDRPVEIQAAP